MILAASSCRQRSPNFYVAESLTEISEILSPRVGDVAFLAVAGVFQVFRLVDDSLEPNGSTVLESNSCDYVWVLSGGGSSGDSLSVEMFGAVGDGVTDDGPAIQAGLDAVGIGGVLFFPAKTFLTLQELSFQSGQTIIGPVSAFFPSTADGQMTIIRFGGASGSLFAPAVPTAATRNVIFWGIEFDGGTGADTLLDFTRVGYSEISHCNARGSKAGVHGLIIDDESSASSYENEVHHSRFWVSGLGASVNISLRNGANINKFSHLFIGYAEHGIEIGVNCVSNTVFKVDFQGIQNVAVALYVTGAANRAKDCWFEDAAIGIQITTTGSLTRSGNVVGGNVGIPIQDDGFAAWGVESIPDTSVSPTETNNYLRAGRFLINSPIQFTTVAECEIDNPPIAATGTSVFRLFRNTTTSGVRRFIICPGDGTANERFTIDPATGDVSLFGSLTFTTEGAILRASAANVLEFIKGAGTIEAFVLGANGLATSAQIQNNGGIVSLVLGNGATLCELRVKMTTIPSSTTIVYGASSGISFLNTEVQFLTLAGNVSFSIGGHADGRRVTVYILSDGSIRNLTFPATWNWVGAIPATLAANTRGKLTLFCRGATDAFVYADWIV